VEESYSAGRITVIATASAGSLSRDLTRAFQAQYPQVRVELRVGTSRDAIRALYAAEAQVAVTAREVLPDERRAAVQGGLELTGYRFARDALVIVVNPGLGVENLSLEEVRALYRGDIRSWSEFGGPRVAVVPMVQPPESEPSEFFREAVMRGEPMNAPAHRVDSDSAMAAAVASRPGSVGYLTLPWARREAQALRVSALRGLPYVAPDLESIHQGSYPLARDYYLYVREGESRPGEGFVTFVTSGEGQKLVRDAGLVPATVPVRFVRRSSMKSSH
jgi:phosphate transport system substrate-binding protein